MVGATEEAQEAVQDILDGRREFKMEGIDSEQISYFIANPSGEDIRKADWQYSKVYNQAIVDGFLTQSQMYDLLKEKEIITDDYTTQLETVRISLAAQLYRLETLEEGIEDNEKELTAMEVARLRDELFQLNQRVNGPMANTCENLAEDARTDFITSRIIEKKDKLKLWKDFEAYKGEENTALAIKSRFEVMLWMQGLESNFLENTPEQTALREVAQGKLDRALTDLDEEEFSEEITSEAAEEDLTLPDPIEEEPVKKKKPGRPKGTKKKTSSKAKPKKPKKTE